MSEVIENKIAKLIEEVLPTLERVNGYVRQYSQSTDLYNMPLFESVKKALIDCMVDVSYANGQLKYYHVMYSEGRKTMKAEVMQELLDRKIGATAADKTVYNEKKYRDYMLVLGRVEQAFQQVNSKYYLINNTLSAVQQSIANARHIENK